MSSAVSVAVERLAEAVDGDTVNFDVEAILDDVRAHVSDVRATRHPLGFTHVDLTDWQAGPTGSEKCRLHLWPRAGLTSDQLGRFHLHSWTLKSAILLGTLIDETYEPRPNPDGLYSGVRVIYGLENEFALEGRFDLREVRRRTLTVGQVYELAARKVHATELIAGPAVTLLLTTDDDDTAGPVVFTRSTEGVGGTAVRDPVHPDHLTRMLDEISRVRT